MTEDAQERWRRPVLGMFVVTAAMVVGTSGCSPLVRLEVRFVMPSHPGAGMNGLRFHVVGAKTCPPGQVDEPRADGAVGADAAFSFSSEIVRGAVTALVAFRGRHCAVRALGWYDMNGDGVLNAGDFAGTSAVVEAVDRGLFRGNVTRAADVALTLVP